MSLKDSICIEQPLKIGDYQICPLPTGIFGLDGGAMFGTVPKVLWNKSNPSDDQNRIQMESRALLLKSKNRNIIIDTGNGSDFIEKYGVKLGSKFKEMYNVDETGPTLKKSLLKYGLQESDVTDVILTHLHFDHAGGATKSIDGKILPTFKNAKYYVQSENLKTAKNPNIREKASYFSVNFEPLIQSEQLEVLNGAEDLKIPFIHLMISNGHTQGHQAVVVKDHLTQLIYCGDVIPTSSHIRKAWVMGYDLNPLLIIEEKTQLLEKSKDLKTYYYFEHDPYCDAVLIAPDEKIPSEFKIHSRYWL